MKKAKFYQHLYIQVLFAIILGVFCGHFYPEIAMKMKPLGDGFIKLIRMMIPPIIFTTVVTGVASMKNIDEVGKIGIKALIYFEAVTILALLIGLLIGNVFHPGSGLNINLATLQLEKSKSVSVDFTDFSFTHFLLNIIPDTFLSAFTKGEILPILLIAIFFGFGILKNQESSIQIISFLEKLSLIFFSIINFIMKLAPVGAFGSIAYTVGAHGLNSLWALAHLLFDVYLTSLLFIFVILGGIAKLTKFSLWHFLKYIKEELFVVLGTSSSEAVLVKMMEKLENLGCSKKVVSLVMPTGYSFNLDGTSIYLTLATLFIAQALNIHLSVIQQLTLVGVFLFTSKGAAAITGGGFIVLTTTLSIIHIVPVEGVVLLLGIDRFMSEARSLTNCIGNGIATIVIAKWEGDFDSKKAAKMLGS